MGYHHKPPSTSIEINMVKALFKTIIKFESNFFVLSRHACFNVLFGERDHKNILNILTQHTLRSIVIK